MVKFVLLAPRPKFALSMSHLTQEQRYKIDVLHQERYSQTAIAKLINKDKSIVCRELQRNSDMHSGTYKSELAIRKCEQRHQLKPKEIHFHRGGKVIRKQLCN